MNAEHKTTKITLHKKTVKVTSTRDEEEFPRSVKQEGRYILPWKSEQPSGWTQFKALWHPDLSGVPGEAKLDEEPLMQKMVADPQRIENPPENGIRTTWLGEASVLFQLDNVNILTNPNFDERGIKYYHPGDNKRYRKPVYKVSELPRIDCVLISNTHFNHLDLKSVRQLNDRFGEMLLWYCPMGVADWLNKAGCCQVVEMDWWKEDEVDFIDHSKIDDDEETNTTTFHIACTPSQNYHDRTFDDDNAVLWCSWVVQSPRYKLFICGATGYCNVFKSIGRKYGPFHMAALPIGGYKPQEVKGFANVTPEQAVQIHQDLLAMCSLATTWGTFTIGKENYLEPPRLLNEELRKQGLSEMQFFLLKHGESRLIEIKEADNNAGDEAAEDGGEDAGSHHSGSEHGDEAEATVETHTHLEMNGDVEHSDTTVTTTVTTVEGGCDGSEEASVSTHTETESHEDGDDSCTVTTTVVTTTTTVEGGEESCEQTTSIVDDQDLLQQLVDNFVAKDDQPEAEQ